MNAVRHRDWYVGTENMIEKEDVTVCKSRSKVAVIFFSSSEHNVLKGSF